MMAMTWMVLLPPQRGSLEEEHWGEGVEGVGERRQVVCSVFDTLGLRWRSSRWLDIIL